MNISTVVSTTRFSSITAFIDNLKKLISLYHQGITVPAHIHQTLMTVYSTVYNTTIIQCNHSISTIIIYLFNVNVPLTDFISQYVHLIVHVNSTLHLTAYTYHSQRNISICAAFTTCSIIIKHQTIYNISHTHSLLCD